MFFHSARLVSLAHELAVGDSMFDRPRYLHIAESTMGARIHSRARSYQEVRVVAGRSSRPMGE